MICCCKVTRMFYVRLFVLTAVVSLAAAGGEWREDEMEETFVEYPPAIQLEADQEAKMHMNGNDSTNTGAQLPIVTLQQQIIV